MNKSILFTFSFLISYSLSAQWTTITSPPNGFRSDHSFGFSINDVGYLVTGQVNGAATANFFSYDAISDQWSNLPDFPGGTRAYAIGDVINGKAYFGFGQGANPGQPFQQKNDLWEFDPATGQWTELSSCPCVTRRHPALVANQGKIFVGMGDNETLGNLNDWWEYDIATDSWTQKTDFPGFKRHHPYQFSIGNFVYAGFGHGDLGTQIYKEWYRYDPANDTWTQVSDIPGQARVAGTQFSHNGYGYVLSGDGQIHNSMPEGEFWRYDESNDTWLQLPSHPGKSRWAPASFIINDEIYLINGAETPSYYYPNTSFKFNLNNAVGLSENATDHQLSIFPNPFLSEVKIDLSSFSGKQNLSVVVYNTLGQKVFEQNIEDENNTTLNLDFLEKSVYLIEVDSNGQKLANIRVIKSQ